MTQNDLNRSVARSTGESVREISHRGFVPLDDLDCQNEEPLIDWDTVDAEHSLQWFPIRKRPAFGV
ncbi:hypothetical protein [Thalassoroseus pseudoceratinae]|uniref:hypothetical protein n=1 Tax=Thalassoroseus pseudoceratinae TaxID=2713176 RepID=UPI0014230500|nr:hypothetical protein [Thalassoroseus pseudoceratinae]